MELPSFESCPHPMAVAGRLPKGAAVLKEALEFTSAKRGELTGGTLVTVLDVLPLGEGQMLRAKVLVEDGELKGQEGWMTMVSKDGDLVTLEARTSGVAAYAKDLPHDELMKARAAFSAFDVDGSGLLSIEELKRALTRPTAERSGRPPQQQQLSDEDVEAILQIFDENGDGELSFEEFAIMWAPTSASHGDDAPPLEGASPDSGASPPAVALEAPAPAPNTADARGHVAGEQPSSAGRPGEVGARGRLAKGDSAGTTGRATAKQRKPSKQLPQPSTPPPPTAAAKQPTPRSHAVGNAPPPPPKKQLTWMLRRTKTSEKLSTLTSQSFARRVKQARSTFSFKKMTQRPSQKASAVSGSVLAAANAWEVCEGQTSGVEATGNATKRLMESTELHAILDELLATQAKQNDEAARAVATQSLSAAIGKALTQRGIKLDQLFREFDVNGSGEISKNEFRVSIRSSKLGLPQELTGDVAKVDELFATLDANASGFLDLDELKVAFRRFQAEMNEALAAERVALRAEARCRRHSQLVRKALDATLLYERRVVAAQKPMAPGKTKGGRSGKVNVKINVNAPSSSHAGDTKTTTSTSEHEDSVDELKNAAWTLQTEMHQTFEQDAQADVERQRYEAMMKAESDKARELAAAAEQKAAAKRARDKAALGGNKLQAAQQPRSNGPSTSVDSVGQQRHLPSSRAGAGGRTSAPAASQSQRSGARSKR
jgi:Ca2+-binding EF-hand superfamily protein